MRESTRCVRAERRAIAFATFAGRLMRCNGRWRRDGVVVVAIVGGGRCDGEEPCAWTPTAWSEQRAAVGRGLEAAGVDVARVMGAIDRRATDDSPSRNPMLGSEPARTESRR